MYAVGGNKVAAISVGVNVNRVKLIAFVICSVLAVVAGLFSATRVNAVSLTQGRNLELQAIAVCVVGGLFLFGGRGSILGIVVRRRFHLPGQRHSAFDSRARLLLPGVLGRDCHHRGGDERVDGAAGLGR